MTARALRKRERMKSFPASASFLPSRRKLRSSLSQQSRGLLLHKRRGRFEMSARLIELGRRGGALQPSPTLLALQEQAKKKKKRNHTPQTDSYMMRGARSRAWGGAGRRGKHDGRHDFGTRLAAQIRQQSSPHVVEPLHLNKKRQTNNKVNTRETGREKLSLTSTA